MIFLSFTVLQCQPLLSKQRNLAIHFHLECVYTSLTYYDYQPAKEHIKKAQELCGLNINLTGMFSHRRVHTGCRIAVIVGDAPDHHLCTVIFRL